MMTKQDFIALADLLANHRSMFRNKQAFDITLNSMADYLGFGIFADVETIH